ncbi:transmembrane emp24 domain-containing protein 7-like [Sycon ciliatum]|uniref:transmembrane emp24 domain-containing protein 7-like n=1 Tax=Sycon ciliatum TaxID=27933 RepID=UPI0020A910BD|eukprot:scpid82276/ scgid16976/ Transmembrane emp24 domain-containing protein 7; p24 family protein gamma-3; p27
MELQARLSFVTICLVLAALFPAAWTVELTVKIPNKMCFHEDIKTDTKFTFEYQVIEGSDYHIDLSLHGPDNKEIYNQQKQQYDSIHHTAAVGGVYAACFSHTSLSSKTVYFDWVLGDAEDHLPVSHHQALTALESSTMYIHDRLKVAVDYQTHFRLRESQGRDHAETINEIVAYLSLAEAIILVVISILEVYILRSFFVDRRANI